MADADHGVTAIEIKILLTFVVPNLTAPAFNDVHVEQGIYVK